MGKFILYHLDGRVEKETAFSLEQLAGTLGMMVRCYRKDGGFTDGFADPYCLKHGGKGGIAFPNGKLDLWTWAHLDETTRRLRDCGSMDETYRQTVVSLPVDEIESVCAVLYSNPRWGGRLMNRFPFEIERP